MKVNSVFCAEEQVVDSNQAQDNETKSVKIFYKNLEAEIRRKVSAHKAKNEKPKFLVFTIIDYQILLTDPTKIPLDISSTWDCQKLSTEIKVDIKTKPIYAFGLAGGLDNKTAYNVTPLTVILPIKQKAYEVGECSNLEKFEFRGEQGRLSWKNLTLQSGSSGEGEVNLRCLLNITDNSGPHHPRELAAQFLIPNTLLSNLFLEISQDIPSSSNNLSSFPPSTFGNNTAGDLLSRKLQTIVTYPPVAIVVIPF